MNKNDIIEKLKTNENDIFELLKKEDFILLKSYKKGKKPMMASFMQKGIKNNVIVMPSYIPFTSALWLLKYMIISYYLNDSSDIYITIDEKYVFNSEISDIVNQLEDELEEENNKQVK